MSRWCMPQSVKAKKTKKAKILVQGNSVTKSVNIVVKIWPPTLLLRLSTALFILLLISVIISDLFFSTKTCHSLRPKLRSSSDIPYIFSLFFLTSRDSSLLLDKLPPDQKMAFILSQYEGLSYKEVARASGNSEKAVERQIYHARQKLKKLLKPYVSS